MLIYRWISLLLLVSVLPELVWAQVSVGKVRIADHDAQTRIVFELNHGVNYSLFRMHKPERVVIDIQKASLGKHAMTHQISGQWVRSIRHGEHAHVLRLVLDLKKNGLSVRSFLLKKSGTTPHRLVVDITPNHDAQISSSLVQKHHTLVVAVDAGHGGEDPGAIGPHGLQEKKVTLAIAKKLVAAINAQKGMHAFLTRKQDYFVPLKKRVRLVRQGHADVMISIHADAEKSRTVKGASVYTLSERGATPDRVAIALAAKENAADEVIGVHHIDKSDDAMVRNILGDMAKRESLNSSQILADSMIASLKKKVHIKYAVPKRARFVVLGALEIPSVLVEVDYISNPRQERKLRTSSYQKVLAASISQGVRGFFVRMSMLSSKK